MRRTILTAAIVLAISPAMASKENPERYTFTATGGMITGYNMPVGPGSHDSVMYLNINGVQIPHVNYNKEKLHDGTNPSLYFPGYFGFAERGDIITFDLYNSNTDKTVYSQPWLNDKGYQHVLASPYESNRYVPVPDGLMVSWDDKMNGKYTDHNVVFTGLAVSPVPELGMYEMLIAGLLLLGISVTRTRKQSA